VQYRKRPWEYFYGLGNDSRQEDRVAYTREQTAVEAVYRRPISGSLAARVQGAFTVDNIFDGLADHLVTNLDVIRESLNLRRDDTRSTRSVSIGGGIEHDWRDALGQPAYGGIERLTVTYHRGVGRSDDLEFVVTELEVQHFLNVFRNRILAARLLVREIDRPSDAPSLPFYLRSGLGGEDDLRGFSRARFVDNDLALLTVEWRYPVWRVVDGFIFLDEARVFSSLRDDFSFHDWHSSAGFGLRVWSDRALHAKALLAFGEEEPRLYLDLGAEF
jgi:outer membrane protein assembly factor BamA